MRGQEEVKRRAKDQAARAARGVRRWAASNQRCQKLLGDHGAVVRAASRFHVEPEMVRSILSSEGWEKTTLRAIGEAVLVPSVSPLTIFRAVRRRGAAFPRPMI